MKNGSSTKSNIEEILRKAVNYWSLTLKMQVVFSLLYFSIIYLLSFYFLQYYELQDDFQRILNLSQTDFVAARNALLALAKNPNFSSFLLVLVIMKALMFPLNIGLFNIYHKIDSKESFHISDLYIGYRGFNFFKFLGFAIFWGFINLYAQISPILVLLWVLITVFCAPLIFFKNLSIFQSIRLSILALKKDFLTIFFCCVLAFLSSYFGALFFLVGLLFTFPFWNAIIYAMYVKYFGEIIN